MVCILIKRKETSRRMPCEIDGGKVYGDASLKQMPRIVITRGQEKGMEQIVPSKRQKEITLLTS